MEASHKTGKLVMSSYQAPKASSAVHIYDKSFVGHPQVEKVSYIRSGVGNNSYSPGDFLHASDESIDARAASYISSVQQRFRLERLVD